MARLIFGLRDRRREYKLRRAIWVTIGGDDWIVKGSSNQERGR